MLIFDTAQLHLSLKWGWRNLLIDKLKAMIVPHYLLPIIEAFLNDRHQFVNIGNA